jgi:predicted AAA+ superfamily ATPase
MNENNWQSIWSKEQVRSLLLEQFNSFWQRDTGITRSQLAELQRAASLPHAVIISGLRRVGKSTLLAQMAHRLGQDTFYYLNFEDDRFIGFQAGDMNFLYQTLVECFNERKTFILDEVQNISGWEHFVRRFMEMGFKFYITGSNASLLSRELGTRLTGRYVPVELFPFSFQEFLLFREEPLPDLHRLTTLDRGRLDRLLEEYMHAGGIPDALKYPELPLHRTLYDDVLYRDIAARYRLDSTTHLRELAYYLMSNPAHLISFNKLKEQLRLGSVNTIKSYVDYMENSWLLFTLNVYDFSVKRQQIAPKKVYCIDTGLASNIGFSFSPNTGSLLENLVFLALRRKTSHIHYYTTSNGYEVDFYLPEKRLLIQVTQHLNSPTTREREIRALEDACKNLPVEQALILCEATENDFALGNTPVSVQSLSEWLVVQ